MVVNGATPGSGADQRPASPHEPEAEAGTELPHDLAMEDVDEDASQEVMNLLSEHVPLALLADLAIPQGPSSPEILDEEGLPEVAWWEGADDPTGTDAASETGAAPGGGADAGSRDRD